MRACKRTARAVITLNNSERLEAHAKNSRWSKTRATQSEIQNKFIANDGNFFSVKRVERIITPVGEIEYLKDVREYTKLLHS